MGKYAPSFDDDVVCELPGTRTEGGGPDGITCSVQLIVPDSLRFDVIMDIVGAKEFWPHGSFVKPPFAVSWSATPWEAKIGSDGQLLTYDRALLTINYERKKIDPDQLASESIEPTTEFLTLDHKRFTWTDADGDPLTQEEAPGKIVRGLNLVRTVYKVSAIPSSLLTLPGHVNSEPYTSSITGETYDAETLMFPATTLDQTIDTDGSDGYNINLKMAYKPDGWNKFWRSKTKTYEEIWDTETGEVYKPFPTADFSALLG